MRFFYSALLDVFNISRQFPFHKLPESDECAFSRVGWPSAGKCAVKWRGPCRDANAGCTYDHQHKNVRLLFTWWHNGLPLKLPWQRPNLNVDLLVTSTGIWESFSGKLSDVGLYELVQKNVHRIFHSVNAKRRILLSNGVCKGLQRAFFSTRNEWPNSDVERRVLYSNKALLDFAGKQPHEYNLSFYDRNPSMMTGMDRKSPCFHHHPYGKASDLHARFALYYLTHKM